MRILTLAIPLLLAASVAAANPGVNLYYDDCSAGSPHTSVSGNCGSNQGPAMTLVVSAVLPTVTRHQFCGAEAWIDVYFEGNTIPDWWRVTSPDPYVLSDNPCRTASVNVAANSMVSPGCPTLWDTHACSMAAFTMHQNVIAPGTVRLWGAAVIGSELVYDLVGDGTTELGLFAFTINHAQTTGANACTGCDVRASLVLTQVDLQTLTDTPDTFLRLTTPLQNDMVLWQGGVPVANHTVPTHNRSWGAIKAMYR